MGDARHGSRTGIEWRDLYADPDDWSRCHPSAAALHTYLRDRLTAPDPELGREGPVCPFVRRAITEHTLWVATIGGSPDVERIILAVDDAVDVYRRVSTAQSRPRITAVLTVFPDLTGHDVIDAAHTVRKTTVVEQGLMLGQFYPGCPIPGLWNRDFHPLDAPLPMLVVRKMMNTDFPFLATDTDWLFAYLTQVAPDLPRRLRRAIAEQLRVDPEAATSITELRQHSVGEHAR